MRKNSKNLQGKVSRQIKDRVGALDSIIGILSLRTGDAESASYLQARSNEMDRVNRGLERDRARLREDLIMVKNKNKELERENRNLRDRIGSSGSSTLEPEGERSTSKKAIVRKREEDKMQAKLKIDEITNQVMVINENLDRRMESLHACEDKIYTALKEMSRIEASIRNLQDNPRTQYKEDNNHPVLPSTSTTRGHS